MHLKELHAMISHRVMIRREKKDVLTQLPDKVRTVVCIECDKAMERKIQRKMAKNDELQARMDEMSQLPGADGEDSEFVATGGGDMFDQKNKGMLELYSLTGRSKCSKIKEYVFDLFESGQKFLVFGHHKDVLDA